MNGKSLFFSLCGLISTHAIATTQLLYCNGCTGGAKQTAAMNTHFVGNVYVGDTATQEVDAFSVYSDINDSVTPHVREWYADAFVPVDPYLSTVNSAITFYKASPVGWKKSMKLTSAGVLSGTGASYTGTPYPDQTKNVYNVIDSGVDQNNLLNWTSSSMQAMISDFLRGQLVRLTSEFHVVDQNALPSITVTITFADTSKINVLVDYSTSPTSYTIDPKSGRDSHNNNVPATKQAATCSTGGQNGICTYDFDGPGNPTDRQHWQQRMILLGVQVSGGPGSGGKWACVVTGEGENTVYSCSYEPG